MMIDSIPAEALTRVDRTPCVQKIDAIAGRYRNRYGDEPDLVLVAVPRGRRADFEQWLNYKERYSHALAAIRDDRARVEL